MLVAGHSLRVTTGRDAAVAVAMAVAVAVTGIVAVAVSGVVDVAVTGVVDVAVTDVMAVAGAGATVGIPFCRDRGETGETNNIRAAARGTAIIARFRATSKQPNRRRGWTRTRRRRGRAWRRCTKEAWRTR